MNFRPPTYDSPPFFFSHVPAAGGRRLRRRRVRAALPSRRRRPQPIEEGRPESTVIAGESFEEENLTSSSAGFCPSSRRREVRGGRSVGRAGRRLFVQTDVEGLDVCEEKGTQIGGSGPRGISGGEG